MTTMTSTAPAFDLSRLLRSLLSTDDSVAATAARVTLGAVMLPHGLQKTLGLFGGSGFVGSLGFLTDGVGLPWIVAVVVILAESVGALALLAGFASRVAATGIAAVMGGAVVTVHAANGFFMNWYGTQAGEGFEYHLLALGLAAVVVVAGGGWASVDRQLTPRGL